jgi:RimJ/RimL family protein N-acetyltransferase
MSRENSENGSFQIIKIPTKELFEEIIEKFNQDLKDGEMRHMARSEEIQIEKAKEWLQRFKSGETLVSIAIVEGKAGGAGHILINRGKKDHNGMISVVVFKPFRGRGIGTKIFEDLIDQAKKKGLKRIESEPSELNHRAIHIEEKLGFERQCLQKGKLRTDNCRFVSCFYMVKFLDETLK